MAALLKHLQGTVRMFGTDAAADEMAAVRSLGPLSTQTLIERSKSFLPNLVIQVRDPTHAARRKAGFRKQK